MNLIFFIIFRLYRLSSTFRFIEFVLKRGNISGIQFNWIKMEYGLLSEVSDVIDVKLIAKPYVKQII
jgi:hypothetical protein